MNILLLGASGRIGQMVTRQLLNDGHRVRAFVYGKNPFPQNDNLEVFQGDVHNAADITNALRGNELVISTLGSWHTPTQDILSSAIENIIPAMKAAGVSRIITLTGAGAHAPGERVGIFTRLADAGFGLIAGKIVEDSEKHIALLAGSDLDYTIVRSPVMRDWGKPGTYTLSRTSPMLWNTAHRDDVVTSIVGLITDSSWAKSAPYLHRK